MGKLEQTGQALPSGLDLGYTDPEGRFGGRVIDGRYPSPEDWLLPQPQRALIELADKVLDMRPDDDWRFARRLDWLINLDADPKDAQERLRATAFSDMILPDGFPLSLPKSDKRYRDLGLVVDGLHLRSLQLYAYGTEYQPPLEEAFGRWEWQRKLSLRLWYENENYQAAQTIAVTGHSANHRSMDRPTVWRSIVSPVGKTFREPAHHESHSGITRTVTEEEDIASLLAYFAELMGTRLEQAA